MKYHADFVFRARRNNECRRYCRPMPDSTLPVAANPAPRPKIESKRPAVFGMPVREGFGDFRCSRAYVLKIFFEPAPFSGDYKLGSRRVVCKPPAAFARILRIFALDAKRARCLRLSNLSRNEAAVFIQRLENPFASRRSFLPVKCRRLFAEKQRPSPKLNLSREQIVCSAVIDANRKPVVDSTIRA